MTARELEPGTRVTATLYGVNHVGTVVRHAVPGVVWVRWDGAPRDAWAHRMSVSELAEGGAL